MAWGEVLSVKAQDLSFVLLPEILEPKRKCMSSQIKGLNWVIQGSKSHVFREDSILSQTACLSPPIGRSTVSHCPPQHLLSEIILSFPVCLCHCSICFIWAAILSWYHWLLELCLACPGDPTVFIKQMCAWSAGTGRGPCALNKILYLNRTFPIRGFQIYDGPIHLTRCTFKKYVPTPDRYTSAIGFLVKNPWQITPRNNISLVKFGPHVSMSLWDLCGDHGRRRGDSTFPKTKTQSIRTESL